MNTNLYFKKLIFFLILFFCSLTIFAETTYETPIKFFKGPQDFFSQKSALPTCTRVIDGDTIVVERIGKVRLIGVDTPETVHPSKPVEYFGKEASAFSKRMVEGKKVKLKYDVKKKDKYGRTLAYVYLENGTFLNAEIIKQGYGHVYIKYPYFKYLDEFIKYEIEARENKRGLWQRKK